uniref:Uncharacterized protein n=1 Tax=Ditylenchus dipsaci TaxID=166011 RepID=A0A915E635_9BILA
MGHNTAATKHRLRQNTAYDKTPREKHRLRQNTATTVKCLYNSVLSFGISTGGCSSSPYYGCRRRQRTIRNRYQQQAPQIIQRQAPPIIIQQQEQQPRVGRKVEAPYPASPPRAPSQFLHPPQPVYQPRVAQPEEQMMVSSLISAQPPPAKGFRSLSQDV